MSHTGPYTNWQLSQFRRTFERGGLFAYPTETVFGVGCDPADELAVVRLLQLKRRSWTKGLILIASSFELLEPWLSLHSQAERKRLLQPARQPTTWLVPATSDAPEWITGDHRQVAVRITDFPPVVRLCETVDAALVSTSANLAGHPVARTSLMVRQQLGSGLDLILGGETGHGRPSEIRDIANQQIIRAG